MSMDYTKFEDEELYRLLLNAIEAQTNNTKYAEMNQHDINH